MTELVIGASGLLGTFLFREARRAGAAVSGTFFSRPAEGLLPLDLRDRAATAEILDRVQPAIVYLPAARPHVDWIEANVEESRAINVGAPMSLIGLLKGSGSTLVYYSSDYVFDGERGGYAEEDLTGALCEYGRQKLEVERAIAASLAKWLVIRTTGVFGWDSDGKNFAQRAVDDLRAGKVLRVPFDQYGNPTYAPDLARASRDLAAAEVSGVFHVIGRETTHRYGFAVEIARVFDLPQGNIEPIETSELRQAARRPLRGDMVPAKAERILGREIPGYRDALRRMRRSESRERSRSLAERAGANA